MKSSNLTLIETKMEKSENTHIENINLTEITFKNEAIEKAVNILLKNRFRIFTSKGSYESNKPHKISYIYYQKRGNLGYLQAEYYGIKYSTVHKSKHGSGFGTGFGLLEDPISDFTIQDLERAFIFAPKWARGDVFNCITKYNDIQDYLKHPVNRILKMYEIKNDLQ